MVEGAKLEIFESRWTCRFANPLIHLALRHTASQQTQVHLIKNLIQLNICKKLKFLSFYIRSGIEVVITDVTRNHDAP